MNLPSGPAHRPDKPAAGSDLHAPPAPATPSAAPRREHLPTEARLGLSSGLDALDPLAACDVFQAADLAAFEALAPARADIAAAVRAIAERLAHGGRLFYVGAGTSGRLGVLDAAECPPTFLTPPELVQGVIAGGERALTGPVEGAEDDRDAGAADLARRGLCERDAVVGISAGGTTPYVHGALAAANAAGALTVFLACVPRALVPDEAQISIRVVTGPEVLAGSTRLKAGTATKLVLNRLSTLVMARLGKVHDNLMIDVDARANHKLRARAIAILGELTGLEREAAAALLGAAGGAVKVAAAMHAGRWDAERARAELAKAGGHLRAVLAAVPGSWRGPEARPGGRAPSSRASREPWPAFVARFRSRIEDAAHRLRKIPLAEALRRPAPGKWSKLEIVGHLVDSASNNHQRFVRARFQAGLVFPAYDQDAWVAAGAYQEADWAELVALVRALNLQIARVFLRLPREELERPRLPHNLEQIAFKPHAAEEAATLEWFARDYVDHFEHHLRAAGAL